MVKLLTCGARGPGVAIQGLASTILGIGYHKIAKATLILKKEKQSTV